MQVSQPVESVSKQAFQEKLDSLDLELIAKKLMHPEHGQGWTPLQVNQAITRYKMFLYLIYLYPNSLIVPTQEIDLMWHQHILDTRKYAQDCQWLFGYFVHHYPYFGLENEAERLASSTAFSRTIALFAEHFGVNLIENIYDSKNACATIPKGQLYQPSACIDIIEG